MSRHVEPPGWFITAVLCLAAIVTFGIVALIIWLITK